MNAKNENKAPEVPAENTAPPDANFDMATDSQRFTETVIKEYSISTAQDGILQVTDSQRILIQGYFLVIDRALKTSEESRLKKNGSNSNHDYDNLVPYDWKHINLRDLALDCVHYAKMGLDMQEKNHLFPIPYKNGKTGLYDISFTVGYNGIRYMAMKYALIQPKCVTIEVIYTTDKFIPYKKSRENPVEAYDFTITNPFDRGEIVGGFGYIEYDDPSKNMLIIMPLKAIQKRMGKNASAEFWGTELTGKQITVWEKGQKKTVDAEGWVDEMCRKTLIREVYSEKYIPRDPAKIDGDYRHFLAREVAYEQFAVEAEEQQTANSVPIDVPTAPVAALTDKTPTRIPMQTANKPTQAVNTQKELVPTNNTPVPQKPVSGFTDPDF